MLGKVLMVKRKVASLKSCFKYLYDKKNLINENPTLQLEAPKQTKNNLCI